MGWLVDFVREKEGEELEAYADPIGIWTIGVGLTRIHGRAVKKGDTITKEQSKEFLEEELNDFLDYVISYGEANGYDWNNKQIAALTSFVFNLGKGGLKQLTANGTRDNETIAAKMLLYKKAGGRTLKGLEIRRKEESAYFKS